jgi:hypothetical protein
MQDGSGGLEDPAKRDTDSQTSSEEKNGDESNRAQLLKSTKSD